MDKEFEQVRQYISSCPLVSNSDHPAIVAALAGLDQERRRRERDAALQRKFAEGTQTSPTHATDMNDIVQVEKPEELPMTPGEGLAITRPEDVMADNDWQDVEEHDDPPEDDDDPNQSHCLVSHEDQDDTAQETQRTNMYKPWATQVVQSIAQHQVLVATPTAAVAVALHAALVSQQISLVCTGIPETTSGLAGGFAAPVRDLPTGQFLPNGWDQPSAKTDPIVLRYRHEGNGSVILKVAYIASSSEPTVDVSVSPLTAPNPVALKFQLNDHVNLESWNRASHDQSLRVPPALHYKSLATLLQNFDQTFDLRPKSRHDASTQTGIPVDSASHSREPYNPIHTSVLPDLLPPPSVQPPLWQQQGPSHFPIVSGLVPDPTRPPYNEDQEPTIDRAFPWTNHGRNYGDFASDLAPGGGMFGGVDPLHPGVGGMTGNWMGPQHPMFQGGSVGPTSGFGMRPRFDPHGPPGGPTETRDPNHQQRPGGSGNPNPDHLRPPSDSLGSHHSNMFM